MSLYSILHNLCLDGSWPFCNSRYSYIERGVWCVWCACIHTRGLALLIQLFVTDELRAIFITSYFIATLNTDGLFYTTTSTSWVLNVFRESAIISREFCLFLWTSPLLSSFCLEIRTVPKKNKTRNWWRSRCIVLLGVNGRLFVY